MTLFRLPTDYSSLLISVEMAVLPPGVDLSKVPARVNPSGAPPNFDNPPTLAPVTLGISVTMSIITAAFVMVRLYTNAKGVRKLGLDDRQTVS